MKYEKIFGMFVFSVLGIAILSASVIGVGVGFSEMIEVYPGQSSEFTLALQNFPAGGGEVVFVAEVTQGSEYVSFPDGLTYNVGDGDFTRAKMRVSVPSGTAIGTVIPIKILFTTSPASGSEGDTVNVNSGIGIVYDIVVVEEPQVVEEESGGGIGNFWIWAIVILVIVVIIVVWLASSKHAKSKEGNV